MSLEVPAFPRQNYRGRGRTFARGSASTAPRGSPRKNTPYSSSPKNVSRVSPVKKIREGSPIKKEPENYPALLPSRFLDELMPNAQAFRDFATGGHVKADADLLSLDSVDKAEPEELLLDFGEDEVQSFSDPVDTVLRSRTNDLTLVSSKETQDGTSRNRFEGYFNYPPRTINPRVPEPSFSPPTINSKTREPSLLD